MTLTLSIPVVEEGEAAVAVVEEAEALAEAVTKPPFDWMADGFVTLASLAPQPSIRCVASLAEAVTKPPIDWVADGFVTLASLAPQPSSASARGVA